MCHGEGALRAFGKGAAARGEEVRASALARSVTRAGLYPARILFSERKENHIKRKKTTTSVIILPVTVLGWPVRAGSGFPTRVKTGKHDLDLVQPELPDNLVRAEAKALRRTHGTPQGEGEHALVGSAFVGLDPGGGHHPLHRGVFLLSAYGLP